MYIFSELLGHSKMNIRQAHYGKIVKKKIGEQMMMLNGKLGKKPSLDSRI